VKRNDDAHNHNGNGQWLQSVQNWGTVRSKFRSERPKGPRQVGVLEVGGS